MCSKRTITHKNDIEELAYQVQKEGPEVDKIAKKSGQCKETVRNRFHKILMKGRKEYLQAAIDYERLGLTEAVAVIEFDPSLKSVAPLLLQAMNIHGFLVSYARSSYDDMYLAMFNIPTGFYRRVERSLEYLHDTGVISRLEISRFDWFRAPPINPKMYDFEREVWDIEWPIETESNARIAKFTPPPVASVDYLDLLILKELQRDANRGISAIADSIHEGRRKVQWHTKKHVFGKHMVSGYRFRWMGENYQNAQNAVLRRYKYEIIAILGRGLNTSRMKNMHNYLTRLPVTFCEAIGAQNYYAMIALPLESIGDGINHINAKLASDDCNVIIVPTDQSNALTFTLPYERYDREKKRWVFNEGAFNEAFSMVTAAVKNK